MDFIEEIKKLLKGWKEWKKEAEKEEKIYAYIYADGYHDGLKMALDTFELTNTYNNLKQKEL